MSAQPWTPDELADLDAAPPITCFYCGESVRLIDAVVTSEGADRVDAHRRCSNERRDAETRDIALASVEPTVHGHDDEPAARIVRLSDVMPERVGWLWPARIPLGKLTVLDGDPGLGKSTISIDLAARVSTGRPMPDDTTGRPPAGVVLLSAEDGLADTIRPRLDAAGADTSRVVALAAIVTGLGIERLPSLPIDLPRLETAIVAHRATLVVVDVLMAFLDGAINAHRDQDVRGALAQLAAMAERTGAAILVLRHLNKSAGGPAIYRGGGSIGIVGAARSALVVGIDPQDESRCILAVTKANLARLAPSLAYRIVDASGTGRIFWEGATDHTAAQLLAMPTTPDERTAVDDAQDVLSEILSGGPVGAKEVRAEARSAGIADRTLDRAKQALGVTVARVGGLGSAGRWEWSLAAKAATIRLSTSPPGDGVLSDSVALLDDPFDPDIWQRMDEPEPEPDPPSAWSEVMT